MKRLVFLLLFLVSWPSFAQRLFDVEIILFKRNQDPATVNEHWPEKLVDIDYANSISLSDKAALRKRGITLLSKNHWELNSEYQKLRNHAGFTPLVHMAWRQGDGARPYMPKLRLSAGKNWADMFRPDGSSLNAAPLDPAYDAAHATGGLFELDGILRVYVQHYLFLETDMVLREPSTREVLVNVNDDIPAVPEQETNQEGAPVTEVADTAAQAGNSDIQFGGLQEIEKTYRTESVLQDYAFKQKRRMRSGETHYLDHPLMGMIIQVRKVQ
ncbi:peptidoglycan binding protein CsiV [Parasalinivibrio latis]|uniref:peptidoglycan binding protein CsiV n=1 Tax=Parasalinivibrio latis TaxID=2952610 RepID=UPI0030E18E55